MTPTAPSWTPTALADAVAVAADGATAYAALAAGAVLASTDGGARWQSVSAPRAEPPIALLPTPSGLFVASHGGLVRLGRDDAVAASGLPPTDVLAVAWHDSALVAGTRGSGVFRSADGGATWIPSSEGLPYGGVGLVVSSVVAMADALVAAHSLGVSRSDDGGRHWAPVGFGLPRRMASAAMVSSGSSLFAEVDGGLFHLDGAVWTGWGDRSVELIGADAHALYGLDPGTPAAGGGLVWMSSEGGEWTPYGVGLPHAVRGLALGTAWHLAVLSTGHLWHCPASWKPRPTPRPRLDAVAPSVHAGVVEVVFWLPAASPVLLEICDAEGRPVRTVAETTYRAGAHRVGVSTASLPGDLYRFRLTAGTRSVSRLMAVVPLPA